MIEYFYLLIFLKSLINSIIDNQLLKIQRASTKIDLRKKQKRRIYAHKNKYFFIYWFLCQNKK